MKQRYHTILKATANGAYVGWVEEIPGALTCGQTLNECRRKLRESLQLLIETHRDNARRALDDTCIQEDIEIESFDPGSFAAVPVQDASFGAVTGQV